MALNLLNPQEFADLLEVREKAGDGYIMCAYGQDPKKLSERYVLLPNERFRSYIVQLSDHECFLIMGWQTCWVTSDAV